MRRLLAVAVLLLVPAPASAAALKLRPCGKRGFQCGRLAVPLDYDDPAGGEVSIPVIRLRARHPQRRLGTLFVNYGGPGADAVATTRSGAYRQFRALRGRFDLVAFDPRGTGASRPALDCRADQERSGVYRHPFPTPATYERAEALRIAAAYATRCAARNQRLAPHVSTANVARDMDRVRAALGVGRVTYFGFSYGTLLGATYAALFPERVRAMVLDGPVDPSSYLNDPLGDLARQSAGFEDALSRYFAACRATHACRWTRGRAPAAAYDRLAARAAAHPLRIRRPAVARGDRRPVDRDVFNFAISSDLYAKQLWPEITVALDRAARGDGSLLRSIADLDYGRRRNGTYAPDYDRYFIIGAAEQQFPREVEPYERAGAASFAAYPHFFFNAGYSGLPYAQFAPRDQDAYLGPFALPDAAPTPLVVATTHDPATPLASARGMVAELGRATLLTMRGDGHTAYRNGSRCIDRAVEAYLIRLASPAAGTTCRQHVPFPPRSRKRAAAATASTVRSLPRPGR